MAKLTSAAHVATSISAVVGIIVLVVTIVNINSNNEKERIRQWQGVAVFSVVEKRGPEGATFDTIREDYLEEVKSFRDFNVPQSKTKDAVLQRVLLRLLSDGVIVLGPDKRYTVNPFQYSAGR